MADLDAAQHAQLIAGGAAGAGVRVYLLKPSGWLQMLMMGLASFALAATFGETAYAYLKGYGMNLPATGALVALVGLGLAEGAVKAAARFEIGALFKRGGK